MGWSSVQVAERLELLPSEASCFLGDAGDQAKPRSIGRGPRN